MRVQIDTPYHSFAGRVVDLIDGDDLEGTFKLIDDDGGEQLVIYGWRCRVTILPACEQIGAVLTPN